MSFLKKKIGPISIWWILLLGLVSLGGVIVGSFFDLSISKEIATRTSLYAKIIESFGTLLACTIAPIGCAILTKKLFVKGQRKLFIIGGIIMVILAIAIPAYFLADYVSGQAGYSWMYNKWIGFAWVSVLFIIIYFGAFMLVDDTIETKILVKSGLYMLVGFAISMVVINFVLKGLIYRPRYRAIAWDNPNTGTSALGLDYYQPWWSFSFWKKPDWFINANLPSDYIKSWPSGHTATATCLLLMPIGLNVMKGHSNKRSTFAFILCLIQVFIVAFGRMVAGAHFLSDVSSAVFITLIIIFLPCPLISFVVSKIFK